MRHGIGPLKHTKFYQGAVLPFAVARLLRGSSASVTSLSKICGVFRDKDTAGHA